MKRKLARRNRLIERARPVPSWRSGGESLEDAFVRIVGAEHQMERLDWL